MSGPKGYGYTVVSEAERRRREDAARFARCEQHAIALAGLIGQLRHLGAPVPQAVPEPSARTHEALIVWESALQQAISSTEARIREESAKAIRRRLDLGKRSVDPAGVSLGARRPAGRPAPAPGLAAVAAEVAKVIDVIAGVRDASAREDLTRLAERVARTTSPAQAKGDLLTLKTEAANALDMQGYRDLAVRSTLEIADITTPAADAVRARAAEVASAADVAEVRRSVAQLVETAERASDAEFVEAALEEVLVELGFGIGEGFALADLDRSVAVADHAEHPGYRVRVQLNPANGMIYTRVVAERAATPEEDARAERDSCDKVHAMAQRLQQHGVAAEMTSERQPGEVPVERAEAKPAGTRRNRQRSRTTPGRSAAR